MICPDCKGDRQVIASHVSYSNGSSGFNKPFWCTRCKATGEVPDETAEWIRLGQQLRDFRVNSGNYRNLAAEADRRGITTVELSQMERGVIKPEFPPEASRTAK